MVLGNCDFFSVLFIVTFEELETIYGTQELVRRCVWDTKTSHKVLHLVLRTELRALTLSYIPSTPSLIF